MKRILILAVLLALAQSAQAVRFCIWADGSYHARGPATITLDGRTVISPTMEQCEAAGTARWETDAEVAAREAIEAAQAEETAANAALYADPQPAVFAPRVDSTVTNVVGESQILVDAETGEVFALDETGSPEHTLAQKQAQNAEREARKAAARKAKAHGNLQARIEALEALAGIE